MSLLFITATFYLTIIYKVVAQSQVLRFYFSIFNDLSINKTHGGFSGNPNSPAPRPCSGASP